MIFATPTSKCSLPAYLRESMLERSVQWETLAPRTAENVPPEDAILWREVSRSDPLQRFLWSAGAAGAAVLLLVNDPHRGTRTRPVLAALCEARRGLTRQPRFRVLVATGTHRFDAPERRAFETATFHDCGLELDAVAWHDAFDSSALAEIAGFRMHRWIDESKFLLPIGSVGLHYFAGLTGAHKTATIGCMSYEDIERNHAGAMNSASDAFVCRGNPVFDDIARTLGAPDNVPAGKQARNTSMADSPGLSLPSTWLTRCMTCE